MATSSNLLPLISPNAIIDGKPPRPIAFIPSGLMGKDLLKMGSGGTITVSNYLSTTLNISMRSSDTIMISGKIQLVIDPWTAPRLQEYPLERLVYVMPITTTTSIGDNVKIGLSTPLLVTDYFASGNTSRLPRAGEKVTIPGPCWSAATSFSLEEVDASIVPSVDPGRKPILIDLGIINLDPNMAHLTLSQLTGVSVIPQPAARYEDISAPLIAMMNWAAGIAETATTGVDGLIWVDLIRNDADSTFIPTILAGPDRWTHDPIAYEDAYGINVWLTYPQFSGMTLAHAAYSQQGVRPVIAPMATKGGNAVVAAGSGTVESIVLNLGPNTAAGQADVSFSISATTFEGLTPIIRSKVASGGCVLPALVVDHANRSKDILNSAIYLNPEGYLTTGPDIVVGGITSNVPPLINPQEKEDYFLMTYENPEIVTTEPEDKITQTFITSKTITGPGLPDVIAATQMYCSGEEWGAGGPSKLTWVRVGSNPTLKQISASGTVATSYKTGTASRALYNYNYPTLSQGSTLYFRIGSPILVFRF